VSPFFLITGGAGFIGSSIARVLLKLGAHVRILDNFSSGKRENLAHEDQESQEIIEGDIRDLETCRRAAQGVDYILHHAALASVPLSIQDPQLANDNNITGTLNMLVAARDAGVKRFVFASSTAVYGDARFNAASSDPEDVSPVTEAIKPAPLSPYAVSKLAGEEYCRIFSELYGLETVIFRYFNIFGPRQDPASEYAAVIPRFIDALLSGRAPIIYGDGSQSRDFIYIDDIIRVNLLACTAPLSAVGRTFNIASGKRTTISTLLHELQGILDSHAAPIHQEARPGDIRHSWADISLARELLGFEPACTFHDSLAQTAAWFKNGERSAMESRN
jgi:UDP-N-acetylglucosamine/UDP-N-acetylgalactosamine 4-epimerase